MRIDPHLKLRRVGNMYMIVDARTGQANLTHVYNLNETAAAVWQLAAAGEFTAEKLAEGVCREYEIGYDEALRDVKALLESWQKYGLLQND